MACSVRLGLNSCSHLFPRQCFFFKNWQREQHCYVRIYLESRSSCLTLLMWRGCWIDHRHGWSPGVRDHYSSRWVYQFCRNFRARDVDRLRRMQIYNVICSRRHVLALTNDPGTSACTSKVAVVALIKCWAFGLGMTWRTIGIELDDSSKRSPVFFFCHLAQILATRPAFAAAV